MSASASQPGSLGSDGSNGPQSHPVIDEVCSKSIKWAARKFQIDPHYPTISKLLKAISSQMKAPFHWAKEVKPYSQEELRKGVQHGIMRELLDSKKTVIKPALPSTSDTSPETPAEAADIDKGNADSGKLRALEEQVTSLQRLVKDLQRTPNLATVTSPVEGSDDSSSVPSKRNSTVQDDAPRKKLRITLRVSSKPQEPLPCVPRIEPYCHKSGRYGWRLVWGDKGYGVASVDNTIDAYALLRLAGFKGNRSKYQALLYGSQERPEMQSRQGSGPQEFVSYKDALVIIAKLELEPKVDLPLLLKPFMRKVAENKDAETSKANFPGFRCGLCRVRFTTAHVAHAHVRITKCSELSDMELRYCVCGYMFARKKEWESHIKYCKQVGELAEEMTQE